MSHYHRKPSSVSVNTVPAFGQEEGSYWTKDQLVQLMTASRQFVEIDHRAGISSNQMAEMNKLRKAIEDVHDHVTALKLERLKIEACTIKMQMANAQREGNMASEKKPMQGCNTEEQALDLRLRDGYCRLYFLPRSFIKLPLGMDKALKLLMLRRLEEAEMFHLRMSGRTEQKEGEKVARDGQVMKGGKGHEDVEDFTMV